MNHVAQQKQLKQGPSPPIRHAQSIDDGLANAEYTREMRRVCFSLLAALVIAWGGVASATTNASCSDAQSMAAAQARDAVAMDMASMPGCQDHGAKPAGRADTPAKSKPCQMQMACCYSPTLTQRVEPAQPVSQKVRIVLAFADQSAPPRSPLGEHWRPPRTI